MLDFRAYASGSTGNLYSLTDGQTTLMIECGLPWKQVRESFNFKTHEVSGVLCGHEHKDHSKGLAEAAKAGLDCYMLPETASALGLSGHRIHEIELLKVFEVGTFRVLAFPLEHDVPICGFLMESGGEKALYISDSYYCRYRFSGLSIIAVECNYSPETLSLEIDPAVKKRLLRSHFSLENVLAFLAANDLSRVESVHLLHISRDNGSPALFRRKVEEATGVPTYTKE